jgi:hypothetical protein
MIYMMKEEILNNMSKEELIQLVIDIQEKYNKLEEEYNNAITWIRDV